jgi:PAS domain S-box-containing protein
MSASDLEALRLRNECLEAEVERLRQLHHQAGVDAALAAVRTAETEGRLGAILDSATDYAIFTTDERGFVTSWNEGAWRLLGWHEDEIVGRDGRVIFTPEDRAEGVPEQEMQAASTEGRAEDERWHLRKDGTRFWASGIAMPLRSGLPGFLKILRDRTEQLHASRNETRRLNQMKALAEAARTVVGAADLSTTLQAITDAARDIIGAHQAVCSMTRGPDWSQAVTAVSLSEKYAAWKGYDRIADGSGIYAWLCEGNRTVRMTQAELEAHPRWRGFGEHVREHPPMRGWLATPLTSSDGRNLGLIQLSDKIEEEFDQADEAIVVQLAQFAASAIERAQAVEELRSQAEFTNRILAASSDCIKVLDLDAKLQFMSAGGQVVMEVDDFDQIKGQSWPGFWSGPERAAAEAAVEAAKAGQEGRFQGFTPTAKGTPRWCDVVVTPINGADGTPERLLSVSRDITREHRAQQAVAASEARLRSVFEIKTVGVMFWGEGFGLTDMNDAFLEMTGFTREEALGKTWQELTPEEFHPPSWRAVHEVTTQGETTPYEKQYFRKDGSRWWGLFAARKIGDEVVEFVLDVTDRRHAEEELRRLNETLEEQVEERTAERNRVWAMSRDLLAVMGFDGYLKAVNPAWEATLGFDEATLLARPFPQQVHPEDHLVVEAAVERLHRGETIERLEDRLRHADGSWRWIAWTLVPEDGVFYAVGRDITAEKERQAEFDAAQEQLRQAQKMEAVGQLTGGVAHDFNNLLTIIRSSVEFLRRPNLPEERRRRYMEAISDTVDRASKLTSQLLAFARRQALRPEVFDVASRVRSVSEMMRTIAGSRIQVVTEIACEPCYIEADVSQFETALVNMAVNARDAMDGQGRLTVRLTEVPEIPARRGHGSSPGRFLAVSLSDTGSGIPADTLGKIFEPFFTTKEVGKGTGLGLSQVFGFVKQSGGDVTVESEVGRGTTFTLYLPQVDKSAVPASPEVRDEQTAAAEQGHGHRVLVVEDNEDVGQFSTQLLQDLGYETVWAANADDALMMLEQEGRRFDVVFTDVVMPGMNGVDLGHEIKRRHPGLPVVLTSGYSHVLAQEGSHGFELLQKPYAAKEVSRVLRQVMRGWGDRGGR